MSGSKKVKKHNAHFLTSLEDLGDVDIALLGPHLEEKQVFSSKCGPSAMSTSPRSSSSSRYHEVNKKEVSRILTSRL